MCIWRASDFEIQKTRTSGKDVKAWVVRSYFTWELEQPDWYTSAVKAQIPRDMCPGELDRRSTS